MEAEGLLAALREEVAGSAEVLGGQERVAGLLMARLSPPLWFDAVAAAVNAPPEWRRDWLHTNDPLVRARSLLQHLPHAREVLRAQRAVQERVNEETRGQQREYLLRQQLKAIQEELGEDDDATRDQRRRLSEAPLPDEVRRVVDREIARLDRIRDGSPERSVAID